MKMIDLCNQFAEDLEFGVLIGWADILAVDHNENEWLDDEWPDREDELRAEVADALFVAGERGRYDT